MKSKTRSRLSKSKAAQLEKLAVEAARCAYAPYSRFPVGAAVLAESGEIYVGANIENACYGLGICAERVALGQAVMKGERKIRAIAVACVKASAEEEIAGKMPCGACRQWMVELAPEAEVLIVGETKRFRVSALLPEAFRLK